MRRRDRLALLTVRPSERVLINRCAGTTDRYRKPRHVVLLHKCVGVLRHRGALGGRWPDGLIGIWDRLRDDLNGHRQCGQNGCARREMKELTTRKSHGV